MAVPVGVEYSAAVIIVAHTGFRDLIDAGAGAGKMFIRDSADVLLAEVPLSDPCGTVNGTTGQLTMSIAGPDTSANASGDAAYCEFADSDDNVHLALPAVQGSAAESGKIVLNTLTIIAGGPVYVLSAVIG